MTTSPATPASPSSPATRASRRPVRVLVLGGGYVAIWLVKQLRHAVRRGEIDLIVIDQNNYHTFHGLVPELLVGKIQAAQIISPSRRLFAPGHFICAEANAIDTARKQVHFTRHLDGRPGTVDYDHLVVNLGSVDNLTRYRGVGEHTLRLKSYLDCLRVRNHLLAMLELAEPETDPEERRRLLHFVIAGGNYAGIEVAAELAGFLDDLARRDFPGIRRDECRITVVHSGNAILPELGRRFPALSQHAAAVLGRRGVTLRLGVRLKSATPVAALLSDDSQLDTRTIISCTGTARHPLLDTLPFARDDHGRLVTDPFGRVDAAACVWSAGDCAAVPMKNGETAPALALYAMKGGATVGQNLLRTLRGRPLRPYAFTGMGDCCVLGAGQAVGQLFGLPLKGIPAWLVWRSCMIVYLPAWSKRVRTLLDWITVPLFGREITSVQSSGQTGVTRELYEPGQVIIRQGDIGRSMYLIQSGSVEVLAPGHAGGSQDGQPVAILRAGDHFGEIAVLHDVRRTATVRALEPVALLRISRDETRQLVSSFKPFAAVAEPRTPPHSSASAPAPGAPLPCSDHE
ncbi:NADH dehydrogenase, FAD-containing subunit [Opitutaceae bacterium TAV1]|nr:NADH dehydrogenase, FAD-containing subunit [Opitutaceae bacterium TAV1]